MKSTVSLSSGSAGHALHAPAPLRYRQAEQVARSACALFLADGAIDVKLGDGAGRLTPVFDALRNRYAEDRRRLLVRADAAAYLQKLQLEMGLQAVNVLGECLCALFQTDPGDPARHALALECAGALADEALVCRDEAAWRSRQPNGDAAPASQPVRRTLVLTPHRRHTFTLVKETQWAGSGVPGYATAMRAKFDMAVHTEGRRLSRRTGGPVRQRARLRCRLDAVPVRAASDEAGPPSARRRTARLRAVLRRLFGWLARRPRVLRQELRLAVYPAPGDGAMPAVIRVGEDWQRCESSQTLCQAIVKGWQYQAGCVRPNAQAVSLQARLRMY